MKNLAYYQGLPYSRHAEVIYGEPGGPYWLVWVKELPGCKTDGKTYVEAMANLDIAFDDYIEAILEFGSEIQEPQREKIRPEELVLEVSEVSVESFQEEDTIPISKVSEKLLANWANPNTTEAPKGDLQTRELQFA